MIRYLINSNTVPIRKALLSIIRTVVLLSIYGGNQRGYNNNYALIKKVIGAIFITKL